MAKFGPHPAHAGKPKNQGSSSGVHVQKPKTSSAPKKGGEAPQNDQSARRPIHPGGTRGSR